MLGGCGGEAAAPIVDDGSPESTLAQLARSTGYAWQGRWHADLRTPALLEGNTEPLASTPAGLEHATFGFFERHPGLFRLHAPREELKVTQHDQDELGMTHLRLEQRLHGLPVWDHELRVHFDRDGRLSRLEGRYAPLGTLDSTAPLLSPEQARTAALAAMGVSPQPATSDAQDGGATSTQDAEPMLETTAPELGIHVEFAGAAMDAVTPGPRLAYRVEVRVHDAKKPRMARCLVNAQTGTSLGCENLLDELHGTGTGYFGETLQFEIAARSGRYYLEDAAMGSPPQRIYGAANGARLPGTLLSSPRPDRWDLAPFGAGAALEAQVHLAQVEDYYQRVHGRRGALGNGAGLHATVHYGEGFANAFWDGRHLVFGDGVPGQMAPLSAGLDVVAHEYTHAVISSTARLGHAGESGALNEGLADAFASLVEHATRPGHANWTMGEDVVQTYPHVLRDLANPHTTGDPAHVSEAVSTVDDNGGIHANSTIPAHAVCLLAQGGTNPVSHLRVDGIGPSATERILYRAVTRYLGPRSGFVEAAEAARTAATDLFGARSRERAAVVQAFHAVGVLPTP
jgi:thermolysin